MMGYKDCSVTFKLNPEGTSFYLYVGDRKIEDSKGGANRLHAAWLHTINLTIRVRERKRLFDSDFCRDFT